MGDSSGAWGKYSAQYEKFATQIPLYFSEVAVPLLLKDSNVDGPYHVVDVAGGPGTFLTALVSYLQQSSVVLPADSSLTATDFAEGMVNAAKGKLEQMNLTSIGNPTLKFQIVDGSDPQNLQDHYYSHIACMLGIMFFKERAQGLKRLRGKLRPSVGRAVFSTWHSTGAKDLCEEFSVFADPHKYSTEVFQSRKTPLDICKHPEELQEELISAGFRNVVVTQHEHTFDMEEEALLQIFARNPSISQAFPVFTMEVERLQSHWASFFRQQAGKKWCKVVTQTDTSGLSLEDVLISLSYCANIAVADA
jgi:ubiquinone/menaquinone biosynthesis C-methylase UbiE